MIKKIASLMFLTVASIGFLSTFGSQQIVSAAAACEGNFITMPAWYNGLAEGDGEGGCRIKSPSEVGGLSNFIWKIALNVVEMLMQLVGYLSVGYMIYGGFIMMTAGGSDGAVKGRKAVLNAAIGLVISLVAVILVNFVSGLII